MDKNISKTILVTGGCGYIGSHIVTKLLEDNYKVVIIDNLSNSFVSVITYIQQITGKTLVFYEGDIRDNQLLDRVFGSHKINAVIHLAGMKLIDESLQQPLSYFENNIFGTLSLLKSMSNYKVNNLIFSSTASVYGSGIVPFNETSSDIKPNNPYARSKLIIEEILKDISTSDDNWSIGVLRYFNPVGAHESGLIGESPKIKPKSLFPNICHVIAGNHEILEIFGDDYPTLDGTAIRDYIHVTDLANAHIKAIEKLYKNGFHIWNIGTGEGYSIKEVISTFEAITNKKIKYKFKPRRPGDVDVCFADSNKAKKELNWLPQKNLIKMVEDTWSWQSSGLIREKLIF